MNSVSKAYLLTVMLALSTVSFGLGGVVDGVEAQEQCPDDAECETVDGSGFVLEAASEAIGDVNGGDGAPIFPDDGHDGDEDDDLQVVIPPIGSTAVLGYQDTDGDGYSDYEELSGCGVGVSTNPFNPDAHCDNYDGDSLDNDEDPRPFVVDTLLILSADETDFTAYVRGDELVFNYHCFSTDPDDLGFEVALDTDPDLDNDGVIPATSLVPAWDPDLSTPGSGNCREDGNVTFNADFELNVTNDQKGIHSDGVFLFTLINDTGGTDAERSNDLTITVSNDAESGDWTPTCVLNRTSPGVYDDGYCGKPGNTKALNGVTVTYDDNGFPDKHPHPGVNIQYLVQWTFDHTSYEDEMQNITSISMDNYLSDSDCEGGDTENVITHGLTNSIGCGRARNSTHSATFTGDEFDDQMYNFTVDYWVNGTGIGATPGDGTGSTGHDRYIAAQVQDRGGTFTYWGELEAESAGDPFDDHGRFEFHLPKFSHVNDAPIFVGGGHDNKTEPDVTYDREDKEVHFRALIHDDGNYSRVGTPGEDLQVSFTYAIADNDTWVPTADEYTTVSGLETSSNECSGLGVPEETCEYKDVGDSGSGGEDTVDDRVDGNTANNEVFEAVISVAAGKTVHYRFNVSDEAGAEAGVGLFTYTVGELPDDPEEVSSLAGSGADSVVQGIIDGLEAIPADPVDVLTNPDCDATTGEGCESGLPADGGDPWDTDEDGVTDEPNGQTDVVETRAFYIDSDAGSGRDAEHFDDFDGSDDADGVSLHLKPTNNGFQKVDHPVIRVGDIYNSEQIEVAVLTTGTETLCVVEHPGQLDVSIHVGGAFDSEANSPCGAEVTSDLTLKAVTISNEGYVGVIVYNDEDNDDERDGAEDKRSNLFAQSCEDFLIVAIDTNNQDQSIVRLLEAQPYESDPCEDGDGGDGGVLGEDSDDDGIPDTVDDEVPDEGVTDDSDDDGIPDVVDDELPSAPYGCEILVEGVLWVCIYDESGFLGLPDTSIQVGVGPVIGPRL